MKYNLIAILTLLPFLVFSQINLSVDLVTGIEYSYRSLRTSRVDPIVISILDGRNVETGKSNWRFGLNYNKRISAKFFLKTGLRLASIGYKGEKKIGLRWGSEITSMGWIPDPSLAHEIQLIHDYLFIELPIVGRYEFKGKKLSPFIELGVAPSYYLTTRTKKITDIGNESTFQKSPAPHFNSLQVVGLFSMGINYNLNENIQLFGQPIIRYHFSKLIEAPIEEHLYNFGIELGLRKKLG